MWVCDEMTMVVFLLVYIDQPEFLDTLKPPTPILNFPEAFPT